MCVYICVYIYIYIYIYIERERDNDIMYYVMISSRPPDARLAGPSSQEFRGNMLYMFTNLFSYIMFIIVMVMSCNVISYLY